MLTKLIEQQDRPPSTNPSNIKGRTSWRKPQKIELPALTDPESSDLMQFDDWRTYWENHARMTCVHNELPDVESRRSLVRLALSTGWTVLWSGGCLGIISDDDMQDIVDKARSYLRKRHNPQLDCQLFHNRDQEEGESTVFSSTSSH